MFLRSVRIRNFRSLEDVELDGLSQFNVLVGRNNAGKSSVFAALEALAGMVQDRPPDLSRVVTGMDAARALAIDLTFSLEDHDRVEFVDSLYVPEQAEGRKEALLASAFARTVAFSFRAPPGNPALLHLRETRLQAEDAEWAVIQRLVGDESIGNPESKLTSIERLAAQFPHDILAANLLDLDHIPRYLSTNIGQRKRGSSLTDNPGTGLPLSWLERRLINYLSQAFFFNPFRHSTETLTAQETHVLDQNGANLAQVLHTINSNDRPKFREIEEFVHAALPNVGMLQTPLKGQGTRVGFRLPAGGQTVRLHDMGGGVEQLLMVATVLLTTGNESSLFLEEPESHLHPAAQRFLIERLFEGDRQVFATTHSPIFVNLMWPHRLYQITLGANGRSTVTRLEEASSLGAVLADIGARNSDLVLSDAVLFVEGPGDRAAFEAWSEALGEGFAAHNVTVLTIEGGEYADRYASPRDDVLEQISRRALPIPRLFVLDRDHRTEQEISKLERKLEGRVHVLKRRELENYLLVPRVLIAVLRDKYRHDAPVLERVKAASEDYVEQQIRNAADSLYGFVLLKRVSRALGGLPGGYLPRELISKLQPMAEGSNLAAGLDRLIAERIEDQRRAFKISKLVERERRYLDREWSKPNRRLAIAPGDELLEAVFRSVGGRYNKPKDTGLIARAMRPEEIDSEIVSVVRQAVAAARQPQSPST